MLTTARQTTCPMTCLRMTGSGTVLLALAHRVLLRLVPGPVYPVFGILDSPKSLRDIRETACSTFVITSSADAFASGAGETHPGGLAVVDSGATETVGSLPAIEDLLQCRFELNGKADQFRISDVRHGVFASGMGRWASRSHISSFRKSWEMFKSS